MFGLQSGFSVSQSRLGVFDLSSVCRNIYAAQRFLPGARMLLFVPSIVRALRFLPSMVSETRPQASDLHPKLLLAARCKVAVSTYTMEMAGLGGGSEHNQALGGCGGRQGKPRKP